MNSERQIFLLRHAKSDWSSPARADFDRPLNMRGKNACRDLGEFLSHNNFSPDIVICSPSKRTRSTLKHIMRAGELNWPVVFDERLYHGDALTIVDIISVHAAHHNSVMIVAHNPGLHNLALMLAKPDGSSAYDNLLDKYPTGGLCTFTVDQICSLKKFMPKRARLESFIRPIDITKS